MSARSAGAALKAQQDHIALCRRFGQNVRRLRELLGLSQSELGARCAMDRTAVSLIERGYREPRLTVLIKLGIVLKVPIDKLVDGIWWQEAAWTAGGGRFHVEITQPQESKSVS